MLELVQAQWDVPYIHRTASTRDEFRRVMQEWVKWKYHHYPILYLGFHGFPGGIEIGDDAIPVEDLVEFYGKGRGRVIHFSACGTLDISAKEMRNFLKKTEFTAACGFNRDVDWLHSTALEILILDGLSKRKITSRGMHCFGEQLYKMSGSLARHLGFRIWVKGK